LAARRSGEVEAQAMRGITARAAREAARVNHDPRPGRVELVDDRDGVVVRDRVLVVALRLVAKDAVQVEADRYFSHFSKSDRSFRRTCRSIASGYACAVMIVGALIKSSER
jgi:hypothetical protein